MYIYNLYKRTENGNKTLDIELVSLQKNAIEGAVHFENSKKILYRNLAQTYMFWRKANMQSNYLKDCYKKWLLGLTMWVTNQILMHYDFIILSNKAYHLV